jgi:hypothetical protein
MAAFTNQKAVKDTNHLQVPEGRVKSDFIDEKEPAILSSHSSKISDWD